MQWENIQTVIVINHLFRRYDFDNDGFLEREDVRILLSYVPFKTD